MAAKYRIPRLVKPVVAVMAADEGLIDTTLSRLETELGEVEEMGAVFPFDFSSYYRDEMGPGLLKRFASFRHLQMPSFLGPLKRRTSACERMHSKPGGGRRINVDSGYWADAKLVLASTKNYAHRIWICRRVFAELTLRYDRGRLTPLEWTYPDYKTESALEFFGRVRKRYLQQIAGIES
ncbi:MAG: DUF4416 family protein [Candidatus Glassbacteria bacterium]|nr:DUF4416 family protein [Candidatus Glassbacteria bacterium]